MRMKKILLDYLPILFAAVLIVYFAIEKEQSFFKTLPTLVTLGVQLMMCRANRFGFLVGGMNALLYGLGYLSEGLYFTSVNCILISAPVQFVSFINWSKKQTGTNHTELRIMPLRIWIISLAVALAGWAITALLLAPFFKDARMPGFDTFLFAWGLVYSILAALRYVESQYLSAFGGLISIIMWSIICAAQPSNLNYLIINCYSEFMVIKTAINWTKQYRQDQIAAEGTSK